MRIVFMGTPEFSVPSLEALCAAGHDVALVVTRPDARRGRGLRSTAPPVKKAALRLALEVYQPESMKRAEALDRVRDVGPGLVAVVAFGEVLRPEVLAVPEHGCLNVHASLLPKYRGAAPINWATIRGERETGVTVQRMSPELDAGPILAQESVAIGGNQTAGELHDRLCVLGAGVLADVVGRLDSGLPVAERPQDSALATAAPKLSKWDGRVDWAAAAEHIRNLVRGLTPWPGAVGRLVGEGGAQEVILLQVKVVPAGDPACAPGTVLRADGREGIIVRAGRDTVEVVKLKPASGRAMSAADFVRGHKVRPGDRFE
ncbi:MAG: methionyl-tRNA formyltransferase [Candidatus Brocadiia bacterium]|jgi:methionyl-tRNA formyltransferase|nr:methionyl-tRNA formyltransferase [Candidatus Brocadiia bacterium]